MQVTVSKQVIHKPHGPLWVSVGRWKL